MIVEFIGCTGAGKTTLSRMLCEQGIDGSPVVAMPDLLLDRPGLRRIRQQTAVNLVQDVSAFPFFVAACSRQRDYLSFAGHMLARHAPTTFAKLNGMRGIVRRLGMYQLARSLAPNKIVLSDEGTVLTAYLFALPDVAFGSRELEEFTRLVPMPDRIVYVTAPIGSLVRRACSRPDPRRELAGRKLDHVEDIIRKTVEVFDLIAATPAMRDRVIVVENEDGDPASRQQLVDEIADRLTRVGVYW